MNRRYVALVTVVAIAGALYLLGGVASSEPQPTKGSIPSEAWQEDGSIDLSKLPDYIGVLDRQGEIAGYVERSALFPDDPSRAPQDGEIPVVDESLERLVGHMVPGYGFVPLGTSTEDLDPFPVTTISATPTP